MLVGNGWPRRYRYWRGRCLDAERRLIEIRVNYSNAVRRHTTVINAISSAISDSRLTDAQRVEKARTIVSRILGTDGTGQQEER